MRFLSSQDANESYDNLLVVPTCTGSGVWIPKVAEKQREAHHVERDATQGWMGEYNSRSGRRTSEGLEVFVHTEHHLCSVHPNARLLVL
jgi:hypothetical protein